MSETIQAQAAAPRVLAEIIRRQTAALRSVRKYVADMMEGGLLDQEPDGGAARALAEIDAALHGAGTALIASTDPAGFQANSEGIAAAVLVNTNCRIALKSCVATQADGTAMQYTMHYIGLDGVAHAEIYTGNRESLARHIAFLEERGAHSVSAKQEDDGRVIYEDGGFRGWWFRGN